MLLLPLLLAAIIVVTAWVAVHVGYGPEYARRYDAFADRWDALGYPHEAALCRRQAAWYRLPWWRAACTAVPK